MSDACSYTTDKDFLATLTGLEPAISCVTGRRIKPTFPQSRINWRGAEDLHLTLRY